MSAGNELKSWISIRIEVIQHVAKHSLGIQLRYDTYQFLLLIWSPNPGVSVTLNFRLTPFSSRTTIFKLKDNLNKRNHGNHVCCKICKQRSYLYKKPHQNYRILWFSSLQPRDERPVKHVHVIKRSCNFYYKL